MEETEAVADPRLIALGLASDLVIEFPAGFSEEEVAPAPVEAEPAVALAEPAVRPAPPMRVTVIETAPPPPAPVESPRPAVVVAPTPPPPPTLAESEVLLSAPVAVGLLQRSADLSLEQLGIRVRSRSNEIAIPWADVTDVTATRGSIRIRTRTRAVSLRLAVDGVAAPELSQAFVGVILEASHGALAADGVAMHELHNAADAMRDRFQESDDPVVPVLFAGVTIFASAVVALALPEILFLALRPRVPTDAFLLSGRVASLDPRVLLAAIGCGAGAAVIAARFTLGAHADAWAGGTLRGWHLEPRSILSVLRRVAAFGIRYPAVAAAALALGLLLAAPSARVQATVDPRGVHVLRPIPALDVDVPWSDVREVVPIAADGPRHPDRFAVLIRSTEVTLSTNDLPVQNGTDRYFLDLVRTWLPAPAR